MEMVLFSAMNRVAASFVMIAAPETRSWNADRHHLGIPDAASRTGTCVPWLFQLFVRAGKQKEQRPNGFLTSLCQDRRMRDGDHIFL
jgi:hypothetical protein